MQKRTYTNQELSDLTRKKLLDSARKEFAARGFSGASTVAIVDAAEMTRGALYYHFENKKAMFEAVFTQEEMMLLDRIADVSARLSDPWIQLIEGIRTYLESFVDPDTCQIILRDGPSVLGWSRWREIDSEYVMGSLRSAVDDNLKAGNFSELGVVNLTHFLSGTLNEAAMMIPESSNPRKTFKLIEQDVCLFVEKLSDRKRS